ncbi:bifunctional UDP-2,4-diacetamido-2,4,6-trideoxy-beta-L-altropyranose hydrolase/GNAT family N-acetyltransferase [Rosettibacter firmus]|uniref:bifunctional UDP-2,4-diacetamido-2,4,6-trideoxy-beta-L-altropyranose hydrolase/GNAT family N-acetyltransferase n=1 Tax=Rosettibacter firmus TaxID=3111522 RepID=UPI00336BFBB5
MKVSIITEGFENTGYGHITRCISLYQAFMDRNIYPALYINGDEKSKSFLSNVNYELIDWLTHPAQLIKKIINSDIVIIDSYNAGKEFYENISRFTKILLMIDDFIRIDYPPGIVLNGSINAELLPYPKKSNIEYLLGTKYIPIRKAFWEITNRKYKSELESILITFGGQDIRNLTIPVLNAITDYNPELKISVVFGNKDGNKYSELKSKYPNAEFYYSINEYEMKELMINCDLAISAAGQTLYELAATGTPTIAIAVAENQKNNINEWHKAGFILEPIFYNDINCIKKIIEQLNKLKSIRLRKKLGNNGKIKVDGKGSKKVVNHLIEKYCEEEGFYLRKAIDIDSEPVFNLSNDPAVRQQSINKNPITWEEHLQWFNSRINDKNYLFLLAFDKDDKFIGQIRFQIEEESAIVSISITKEFRGKGLSKKIIKAACSKLFNERNIKLIVAYILPDNHASINGFKSAGFTQIGEENINDEKYLKFVLKRD